MKKVSLFFLLILCCSNSFEDSFISNLKLKFEQYLKTTPVGSLQVFFNQSKYITGDTVAMSFMYSRDWDKAPSKQIVYAQLLNEKGTEAWRGRVLLKKGKAVSYFVLPAEMKTGAYTFVAFTEQLRQINPDLSFSSPFYISDKTTVKLSENEKVTISPESGISVNGLLNHFVLSGRPNSNLKIKNKSTLLAELQLDSAGLGNFQVTPNVDDSLSVETIAGNNISFPKRSSEGFQLHIDADLQTVEINSLFKSQSPKGKVYFILATNQGITFYKELNSTEKTIAKFSISEESVRDGLCQAIIIDSDNKVWAKRNLYLKKQKAASVSVSFDNNQFEIDKSVQVNISVVDARGNVLPSLLNASISNSALMPLSDRPVSDDNLIRSNQRAIALNQSPFNWERISGSSSPAAIVEDKMYLTGKVINSVTGEALGDSTHVLFFLKKSLLGYDTYTNAKGEFKAPLIFDFFGEEDLFYCATYRGKDLTNINFQFDENFPSLSPAKKQLASSSTEVDSYYKYIQRKKIVDNSYSFFRKKNTEAAMDYNSIIEDELQGADILFKTEDYVLFPTMAELVKESLKFVYHRVVRGRDVIRVYISSEIPSKQTSPLFVIDGFVSKDPKQFLSLNPENVLTIKIVKDSRKLLRFGELSKYGVIIVKTKSAQPKPETIKSIEGFLSVYQPKDFKKENTRTPDLRASLIWKPQINLKDEPVRFTFNTSNDVGDFTLVVNGFTINGTPIYYRQPIKVAYQPAR